MSTILKDTGERMIPEFHKGKNIYGAHIGRYEAGVELTRGKVVLDIACGSGYGSQMMSEYAKKIYGVDVDTDTIKYAKEHFSANNVEYLVGDGESIPLKSGSVDLVVSYETIEHIKDYRKFLDEVKRVLKPNGLLLLSTPNDMEYAEGNHFHLHEFSYGELKKLINEYFKYRKDYFQSLWMYSSIVPLEQHTSEWVANIKTHATVALKPDQCIYFFMLCSNRKIGEDIEALGVIGEHFRQKDHQANEQKKRDLHASVNKYRAAFEKYRTLYEKQEEDLTIARQRLERVKRTPAYWAYKRLKSMKSLFQKKAK